MKLSMNMLDFLGYLGEGDAHWCDRRTAVALAYPFGIKSALKNGLIEDRVWRLDLPDDPAKICPGLPYGRSFDGYGLTALGRELAAVGKEMRAAGGGYNSPTRPPFVERAQALLDQR